MNKIRNIVGFIIFILSPVLVLVLIPVAMLTRVPEPDTQPIIKTSDELKPGDLVTIKHDNLNYVIVNTIYQSDNNGIKKKFVIKPTMLPKGVVLTADAGSLLFNGNAIKE